jgi:hypothetical protein
MPDQSAEQNLDFSPKKELTVLTLPITGTLNPISIYILNTMPNENKFI